MSTIVPNLFEINGVIDTSQSVMSNINTLCNASGCWMTYDVNSGLWSVVINRAGGSIKSFDDSNIIGSINVSGTGINEAYNKVSVEFPHRDLRDQTDYVDLVIPENQRYPNELDNILNIDLQCINSPIQAQYIGLVELKQSRVDRVIEFRTDYTSLGLQAGDIIDVTAEMYGFAAKKFRITKIVEDDPDDGTIQLAITAIEYSDDVYSLDGIVREERTKKTGIVPKAANQALTEDDAKGLASQVNTVATLGPSVVSYEAKMSSGQFAQRMNTFMPRPHAGDYYEAGDYANALAWASNSQEVITVRITVPPDLTGTFVDSYASVRIYVIPPEVTMNYIAYSPNALSTENPVVIAAVGSAAGYGTEFAPLKIGVNGPGLYEPLVTYYNCESSSNSSRGGAIHLPPIFNAKPGDYYVRMIGWALRTHGLPNPVTKISRFWPYAYSAGQNLELGLTVGLDVYLQG